MVLIFKIAHSFYAYGFTDRQGAFFDGPFFFSFFNYQEERLVPKLAICPIPYFLTNKFIGSLQQLEQLDPAAIKYLFGSASTFSIPRNSVKTFGELAEKTRPGGANLMKTGALKINGIRYKDAEQILSIDSLLIQKQFSLVCWGRRKFSLILWT